MKTAFLLSLLFAAILGAAPVTDEAWAAMRKAAIERPRVIIDDDGCDMTEAPRDIPCTREAIYAQMLDHAKGSQVDTISYCPFAVGLRLATRSLVTDRHTAPAAGAKSRNLTPELLAMGTDTMQLAVEFCRANGFAVLANLRMNDTHDAEYDCWMYGTKVEHPEWLNGTKENRPPYGAWSAYDYARSEVRARVRAICEELLSHYDVDGIELDFYRSRCYFKSVAWGGSVSAEELEGMTQLIRDIRADADRIGRATGRYLIVVARAPDSANVARNIGLDIETWFKEKLIDIYVAGGDAGYFNTYRGAVALGRKHGVRVFSSVDTSWSGGRRDRIPAFQAQTSAALAAGIDGILYFNMFYFKEYIPQIRREFSDLRFEGKSYFGYYQRVGNFYAPSSPDAPGDELGWRRGIGMVVTSKSSGAMEMEVGDDFADPQVLARQPRVTLKVTTDSSVQPPLAARINGTPLEKMTFADGVCSYDVPPSLVKQGVNGFAFSMSDDVSEFDRIILKGDQLLKGAAQPPWRRLFPAHDFAHAEEIVEGSYRLRDSGTGPGQCENLLYPLADARNGLQISFKLMVEESTAAEAVMLRVANGKYAEVVTFGLDQVGFTFAGKSVPFKTSGGFHDYVVRLDKSTIAVLADGTELLRCPLVMDVNDKAGFMEGFEYTVADMQQRSLVVGSLSQEGTGVSRWKDLAIRVAGVAIKDVELEVIFPEVVDDAIAKAIEANAVAGHALFDGAAGGPAKDVKVLAYSSSNVTYKDGVATLVSNNSIHGTVYSMYSLEEPKELQSGQGVIIVDCEVEPLRLDDNQPHCFQVVAGFARPKGGYGLLALKFAPGRIDTPWAESGAVTLKPGLRKVRLMVNPATAKAAILVDGEVAAFGMLDEVGRKAEFYFGDASGAIAGATRLKSLRIGVHE